ncbi:TenA family protein [Pedobacter frigidisoli]|uniref:TenA family protein n=1 Tax=Pedobacter frigidisoli TaxID=2530455 RepID=UPI00292D5037|nr:TenA family protein [Pedobacter frigidisoli]
MKWSEIAWLKIAPIFNSIIAHPFNSELSSGTLSRERFLFYLAQDAYYLLDFARALSTISGRMNSPELVLAFSEFSTGAIVAERSLHERYFVEFGLNEDAQPSPSTFLYTNYILRQAAYGDLGVAVASVLPCFWIYKAVGDHIFSLQAGNDNVYKEWIDLYSGDDFG